jgi:SSS family solute:Na+ symporter
VHIIDWIIVVVYLAYVVIDGLRRAKGTKEIEGYFLANRNLPWWAVGLSVMATQLSAVTMIGTTGQGATDGMRFIQFYFGLPLAMVILGVTLVPFLHRARVFTAYEYLERRFDAKTRSLTAFLFLVSRGMGCGTIIAAPAVVFSAIFGWDIGWSVALMGIPTVIYTMLGGVQAVTWADVKQMAIIVGGVLATVVVLILGLPDDVTVAGALQAAGSVGRMRAVDFTFDVTTQYTFWSGLIGGMFLAMGYFGADQSQVQRYLTAKSVKEARGSLLMSAFVKIPLQVLILLTGVLVFCFYLYTPPPMLFNPKHQQVLREGPAAGQYQALQTEFDAAFALRRDAAYAVSSNGRDETARAAFANAEGSLKSIRDRAMVLVRQSTGDATYIHYDAAADRSRGPDDCRDSRRRHVDCRRGAQLAFDGNDHRFLQAALQDDGQRSALSARVVGRDRALGRVCHDRGELRHQPWIAHRGRQQGRLVLLWVAVRDLRARHRHQPGWCQCRVHRLDHGHGHRGICGCLHSRLLALAERRGHRCRGRRGRCAQLRSA